MGNSLIKEHYEKKTGYRPSHTRAHKTLELLSGLPKGAKVLDIGCGDGSFGAMLRDQGFVVHGCDIALSAIKEAEKQLDHAMVIDIESENLTKLGSDFDAVIAGEVIEHLFKPDIFLEKVSEILNPNGFLIITTPNFLVWSNRIRMLLGQFEYTSTGFLDEGHIHFFTRPSLFRALRKTGYTVLSENHVIHSKIPNTLGKLVPNLFAFQLVVKTKRNTQKHETNSDLHSNIR